MVLQKLTSVNVALNNTTTITANATTTTNNSINTTNATCYDIRNTARYYAGDWISVSIRLLLGQRYSLILTAETLYTLDTCKKVSIYTAQSYIYSCISCVCLYTVCFYVFTAV